MALRPLSLAAFFCCTIPASAAYSAELTAYAALTTDYVFRGVTYSDSDPAAQLGADIALDGGVYFGIWGSSVDISGGPTRQRDLQLNYYAGYRYDVSTLWSLGGNIVAYTFPGAEGNTDYDWLEYSLGANYNDRFWFEIGYTSDLYDSGDSASNYSLLGEWPLGGQLNFSAGIGFYDVSKLSGRDYSYWQLGLSRAIGPVDVDLRYHEADRWVPRISNPDRIDARLVLSARYQF